MVRLDRCFICEHRLGYDGVFPALTRLASDHMSLSWRRHPSTRVPRISVCFRFENSWMRHRPSFSSHGPFISALGQPAAWHVAKNFIQRLFEMACSVLLVRLPE